MDYQQNNMNNFVIDDNVQPETRSRCHTWPLKPVVPSPSVHDSESNPADVAIQEEPEDLDSIQDSNSQRQFSNISGEGTEALGSQITQGFNSSQDVHGSQSDLTATKTKSTARKNAWGNLSYADLITKAIQSSPEKKLTLSQIYDWMVQNVNYFRDKGDSTSSAGWKNSIRHNLSLHNRFMRIQNEGAGKSSWWVINPEAKPGKAPRRRGNSMDNSKSMLDKRKAAMKKVNEKRKLLKDGAMHSPVSPGNELTLSPGDYRERASSFVSNASGRGSPDFFDKISPSGSDFNLNSYCNNDIMETGPGIGQLNDDMEKLIMAPGRSLLDDLKEIDDPMSSYVSMQGPSSGSIYTPQTDISYSGYLSDNNFLNAPPPPYPTSEQNQQQQFNKMSSNNMGFYGKDPMMTSFGSNGNNNTVQPRAPYQAYGNNGMINTQNQMVSQSQQQANRFNNGPAMPQRLQQQNSTRSAAPVLQTSPNNRINHAGGVSQSLRDSAPILTQQLMDFNQTQSNQSHTNNSGNNYNTAALISQALNQQQQQSYNRNMNSYNDAQMSFSDLDFDLGQIPELNCDVDEIIQQELRMDGGQLDLSGFEGYSQQQQQQPSSTKANSSGVLS